MKTENPIAFKEWAVIVNAFRQGKQILILRKGGIREETVDFQVEHNEFFLFPTYEHQNKADLKSELPSAPTELRTELHRDFEAVIRQKPSLDRSEERRVGKESRSRW